MAALSGGGGLIPHHVPSDATSGCNPRLLDQRSAVDALPNMDCDREVESERLRATGTDGRPVNWEAWQKARHHPDNFLVDFLAFYLAKRGTSRGSEQSPHSTEDRDGGVTTSP